MCNWARRHDRNDSDVRSGTPWTPFGIGMMVLAYILFWPLGLVLTLWMVSGRHVADLPRAIGETISGWFPRRGEGWTRSDWRSEGFSRGRGSGNTVFDDYQQTQYDRISEIKREIKDTWSRFRDFRNDEQRRQERDEFDRFMRGDKAQGNEGFNAGPSGEDGTSGGVRS